MRRNLETLANETHPWSREIKRDLIEELRALRKAIRMSDVMCPECLEYFQNEDALRKEEKILGHET